MTDKPEFKAIATLYENDKAILHLNSNKYTSFPSALLDILHNIITCFNISKDKLTREQFDYIINRLKELEK